MVTPVVITKSKKPLARRVPIVARIEGAKEVAITGDFSGWKEDGIKLEKTPAGEWRTTVELAPGEYQYRLRVDGEWQNHPQAHKRVPNPYGSENCILTVS